MKVTLNLARPMVIFLAAIASLCVPFAVAQNPTPPPSQNPVFSARSNLVLVPTLVRTKAGELVFTLKGNDFVVTDDGVEQKVTLEEDTDNQPLALVIAVETGGAGARQLDYSRNLGPMFESVVGNIPHRVAVVTFDSTPRVIQDFTSDPNVAAAAIRGLAPGNAGAAILDALAFSVDLLRRQPPEYRRAILLVSETIDHGSHVELEQALRSVSDTNTTIYSLAFSGSKSDAKDEASHIYVDHTPGPQGGCMSKDPNPGSNPSSNRLVQAWNCLGLLAPPLRAAKIAAVLAMSGLRRNVPESVAQLTGGEFFRFNNTRSLEHDLATISNHVPNRYVLSFQPQSPHAGLHAIEVRLRESSNLVLSARSSYWADRGTTP